jgi:2-dehydropantoate 2-reductase
MCRACSCVGRRAPISSDPQPQAGKHTVISMKVLVMGTGGVGGYFGGLLARAGHDVSFIARGAHLEAMQGRGLTIESVTEPTFTLQVQAHPAPPAGVTADLVMFCVKNYDTQEAVNIISPAVGPDTVILPLQNGVDGADTLAAAFGKERVLGGVAYIEVSVREPGVIAQRGGARRILFGEMQGGPSERCDRLLEEFQAAGWVSEHSVHIKRELWSKLIFIAPFAGMNTVTALAAGPLREAPATRELLRAAVAEGEAVGNAEGAGLPIDAVDRALATLDAFPETGLTSMYRDRLGGKRLESGFLVGSIVRRGELHGIPTPVMSTLESLLAPMADGNAMPAL